MPRPVRHLGSGRAVVIPETWEVDHAAVVDQTHGCWVEVRLPNATPVWNDTAGRTETVVAAPVWEGWATVEPLTPGAEVYAAHDPVPAGRYEVTLPYAAGAGVSASHVVDVVRSSDPMLTGRRLRIDEVGVGSRRFSRTLTATLTP